MQVGVVRTLPSSSRTEMFPSQATMCPRSYIHRPAMQISRRCCSSLFAWPDKSESVVTGGLLPGAGRFSRALQPELVLAHSVAELRSRSDRSPLARQERKRNYYKLAKEARHKYREASGR